MSPLGKSKADTEASLDSLTLSNKDRGRPGAAGPVAASWEDEEADSSSASSNSDAAARSHVPSIPNAPPPTPISPSARSGGSWADFPTTYSSPSGLSYASSQAQSPSSRPEKSTAVAGRMIATALGVKAPKKGEEARAYEHAVKEKESRRISREREERKADEERRQQARRQVWDD